MGGGQEGPPTWGAGICGVLEGGDGRKEGRGLEMGLGALSPNSSPPCRSGLQLVQEVSGPKWALGGGSPHILGPHPTHLGSHPTLGAPPHILGSHTWGSHPTFGISPHILGSHPTFWGPPPPGGLTSLLTPPVFQAIPIPIPESPLPSLRLMEIKEKNTKNPKNSVLLFLGGGFWGPSPLAPIGPPFP